MFSQKVQKNLAIFLFLLPGFIFFLIFQVYPILQSAYYSLFNWTGFGPATKYIGLENYGNILTDPVFQKAFVNAVTLIFLSLLIQLPAALALAIMVGRDLPGRAFFRTIFFMPYVISEVITAIMWLNIYNADPSKGFINAVLTLIPGVEAQPWLGDMKLVFPCLFLVLTWKYFGLHMLLYLAGLQGIPAEVEEAARIDGANSGQLIWNITLPMLRNTIATTVYLSVLGSLQQFILVWVMTEGGPSHASEMLATYLYRFSFKRFQLGYGSAAALVMLVIALTFSITYNYFVRPPEYLNTD
ncbi:MAG: sugar ABC transporter permease [Chloroflexi bacterium RBG_13_60_9]|nr:MAG: sugar ABC transporter permease [Chloroflexi bacterium RBG_13_60_9]